MNDLIALLNARLDEDERTAKAAAKASPGGEEWLADPDPQVWGVGGGTPILRSDGNGLAMAIGDYAAHHIARHDPARVLREVKAKRSLLALHSPEPGQHPDFCRHDMHELPCPTLRLLAAVYGLPPTLLPFHELPAEQQLKDRLFIAIVRALTPAYGRGK